MKNLLLYYKPTCPYCMKVLQFMEDQGIDLPKKDISASEDIRQELISIGGKAQVPCLVIDTEALYESDDIIQWLKTHFSPS